VRSNSGSSNSNRRPLAALTPATPPQQPPRCRVMKTEGARVSLCTPPQLQRTRRRWRGACLGGCAEHWRAAGCPAASRLRSKRFSAKAGLNCCCSPARARSACRTTRNVTRSAALPPTAARARARGAGAGVPGRCITAVARDAVLRRRVRHGQAAASRGRAAVGACATCVPVLRASSWLRCGAPGAQPGVQAATVVLELDLRSCGGVVLPCAVMPRCRRRCSRAPQALCC
jgi:hypothetical protein